MLRRAYRACESEGIGYLARRAGSKTRAFPLVRGLYARYKNRRVLANLPSPLQLHLGCGSVRLDGYVNVDIEDWAGACDMIASAVELPMFADDSVDRVFNHALLEHIPPWLTLKTLSEWYRILKPGGTIRIEVPDLERIFEDWLVKGTISEETAVNNIFGGRKSPVKGWSHQDHLTGFTYDRLTRFMAQVGFVGFERREHQQYHHILAIHARKPVE